MQPVTHQMIDYVNNNNEVERLFGFSQKKKMLTFLPNYANQNKSISNTTLIINNYQTFVNKK